MASFTRDLWTAKKAKNLVEKKEVRFDNPVQRGLVWNKSQKSKLIDSVLKEYPIGQIYEIIKDKYYDTIDGQQRLNAIIEYMNDEFKIIGSYTAALNNGDIVNISKKKFSQLPEELQDRISDFNLDIICIQDTTSFEEREIFDRLNSGKPLTNIERTKAKTKSLSALNTIANHSIFDKMLSEESKNKSTHIGYAMQSYAILFNEAKCLMNSKIEHSLESKSISSEEEEELSNIFSLYERMFETLDVNSKALSKMKMKTHFVSVIPVAAYVIENNIPEEKFFSWVQIFFSSSNATTISQQYNDNLGGGTNSPKATSERIEAVMSSFKSFLNGEIDIQEEEQTKL